MSQDAAAAQSTPQAAPRQPMVNVRCPTPVSATPYEVALWASLALFVASIVAGGLSILCAWGWGAFGAALFTTGGFGVLAKLCQEMHLNNQIEASRQSVLPVNDGDGW